MCKLFILLGLGFFFSLAVALNLSDVQGTWRAGEKGYVQINYTCPGYAKTQDYSLALTFDKQITPNQLAGAINIDFERYSL